MRFTILGLCGWVVAAGAAELEIQIRLQDYANVSPAALTKAKAVASGILANAGIGVTWADCPVNGGPVDAACEATPGPGDLQLRILTREMAKRTQRTRHCMGFAIVAGRFPSIASVFYHSVEEREAGNPGARGEILGGILAHEIGHLLLAENGHSAAGVLRGQWEDEDFRLVARGRMWFTPEQAARMVALVAERVAAARPAGSGEWSSARSRGNGK